MDFGTPYDLSQHITDEFNETLTSKKWSERKDAIQRLIDIVEKNPDLEPNDYVHQKLIDDLSKVLSKDVNINVVAVSALALGKLASVTPKAFKYSAPAIILHCFTRMKDVKPVIKNACIECLDSVYSTTTFANVLEPIKQGLALTALGSKIQACEFFTRIMLKIDFPTAKKSAAGTKEIIDSFCKLAMTNDAACREAAMRSLAAFMRAVTKNIASPLLASIEADKLKMEKIEENYEQFIVEHPFDDGTKKKKIEKEPTTCSDPIGSDDEEFENIIFVTPYDLSQHITDEFNETLISKKWSERKDVIQSLVDIMEKNPVLNSNDYVYQKLIDDLSKILSKDVNINVVAASALALGKLASGTPKTFKNSAPAIILLCLTRMKDVKPVIKNACIECLDSVYSTTTFANVLESIRDGLAITALGSKIQACDFFTRIMLKIDFQTAKNSAAGTREIVDQLCKLAMTNDSACREAAMRSLAAFMRAVSKKFASPLLASIESDKLKMEKIEEHYEKFIVSHPFKEGAKPKSAHPVVPKAPVSKAQVKNLKPKPIAKKVDAVPRTQVKKEVPKVPISKAQVPITQVKKTVPISKAQVPISRTVPVTPVKNAMPRVPISRAVPVTPVKSKPVNIVKKVDAAPRTPVKTQVPQSPASKAIPKARVPITPSKNIKPKPVNVVKKADVVPVDKPSVKDVKAVPSEEPKTAHITKRANAVPAKEAKPILSEEPSSKESEAVDVPRKTRRRSMLPMPVNRASPARKIL